MIQHVYKNSSRVHRVSPCITTLCTHLPMLQTSTCIEGNFKYDSRAHSNSGTYQQNAFKYLVGGSYKLAIDVSDLILYTRHKH
jgi:hypothetical protein